MKSMYLAGKIAKNDWRHEVCHGLRSASSEQGYRVQDGVYGPEWSEHNVTVLDVWRYAGPYFSGCDHGCGHDPEGPGHGSAGGCISAALGDAYDLGALKRWVHGQCLRAIESADIFFAWLDDTTAHGTLVEIGHATALGKQVVLGLPPSFKEHDSPLRELWFGILSAAGAIVAPSPQHLLSRMADEERMRTARTDSPIEAAFWTSYFRLRHRLPSLDGLITQFNVGRYRLDFAIPHHRIAIELDGYEHHSSRDQFTHDRARQRELEQQGWRFIRFSGREVNADPDRCVREAAKLAETFLATPDTGAA